MSEPTAPLATRSIYPLLTVDEHTYKATLLPLLECNAHCPFCSTRVYSEHGILASPDVEAGRFERRVREYTQSLDDLKRTYDELLARGVKRVNLQGGEPTIWEPLPELLDYGYSIGMEAQEIVSNGRRFEDAAFTERLLAAHPRTIVLSLFGGRAERHDESLGVHGAFDDVVAGVQNLLRLTKTQSAPATSITAQFSLHAKNFRELPEMVRFWFEQGLRNFTLRLLRETINTSAQPEQQWFFDLALLREPLAQTFDYLRDRRGVFLTTSEVFYCLLPPEYLGYVMHDLGTNPALEGGNLEVSKHHADVIDPSKRHLAPGTGACTDCDWLSVCTRPESHYRRLLSQPLRSVHVREQIETWLTAGLPDEDALRLSPMLGSGERLGTFGTTSAQVDGLWRLYTKAAARLEPTALLARLFPANELENLSRSFACHHGLGVAVRTLKLSEFGDDDRLGGAHGLNLAQLRKKAPSEMAPLLEFLDTQADCLARGNLIVLFGYVRNKTRPNRTLVLVPLIDDRRLDEQSVLRLLAPYVESLHSPGPVPVGHGGTG